MKEIELRLALVFYGGVSLAIYMHGVSREILNLVRASARRDERGLLNDTTGSTQRKGGAAEAAWGALLAHLGQSVNVRVVVDTIAGASAGGVNGIMLGRALAHDLPLEAHRDLWLKYADVTQLASPQAGIGRFMKSGISPVLDRLVSSRLNKGVADDETRDKLRLLMQSPWFEPPFSGKRYIGWMLDACARMDEDYCAGASLIPTGQSLDLFVTLTDYTGQLRRIRIDDPAFVEEWDHRRVVNFHARHRVPKVIQSQFDPASVPELVFAARATSSFPGAFPPASLAEMDEVLAERGETWPHREPFVVRGLGLNGTGSRNRYFVDGSVVMNKPLAPVIEAVRARPAAREVARRLVYVDPVPKSLPQAAETNGTMPGFFKVILASLAHIPRNEPIGDDLKEIEAHNRRGRWLTQTIEAADPVVERTVKAILPGWGKVSAERLSRCRAQANTAAHDQAGYAYLTYQALKLHSVSDRLEQFLAGILGCLPDDPVPAWLDLALSSLASGRGQGGAETGQGDPGERALRKIGFLVGHDVDYRVRRLRFVVRRLNGFYHREDVRSAPGLSDALDLLKREIYAQIDQFLVCWDRNALEPEILAEIREVLAPDRAGAAGSAGAGGADPDEEAGLIRLRTALAYLETRFDLKSKDREVDVLFAEKACEVLPRPLWRELLGAYVGFAFYDLTIFPVLQSNDFAEVSDILVDRISPPDCSASRRAEISLKGAALNNFGAFFNRRWREHDYLWGRLNAAERLAQIVVSVSGHAPAEEDPVVAELIENLFEAILQEEEGVLATDPLLIAQTRKSLSMGA